MRRMECVRCAVKLTGENFHFLFARSASILGVQNTLLSVQPRKAASCAAGRKPSPLLLGADPGLVRVAVLPLQLNLGDL